MPRLEAGYVLLIPADGATYTEEELRPLQTAANLFGHVLALEGGPASKVRRPTKERRTPASQHSSPN